MPRELARQSARFKVFDSGLAFEIRQRGVTVWVTLSGILDRPRLDRLIHHLQPILAQRELRLILDGRRLMHLDYRAVRGLVCWNRSLRPHGHKLYLYRWSAYLKTILSFEDWARELITEPRLTQDWNVPAMLESRPAP